MLRDYIVIYMGFAEKIYGKSVSAIFIGHLLCVFFFIFFFQTANLKRRKTASRDIFLVMSFFVCSFWGFTFSSSLSLCDTFFSLMLFRFYKCLRVLRNCSLLIFMHRIIYFNNDFYGFSY